MHAVLPVRALGRLSGLGRPEHRVQRQQHQRHQHCVRNGHQPAAVGHHDDDAEEGVLEGHQGGVFEGHQGEVEGQGQWDS